MKISRQFGFSVALLMSLAQAPLAQAGCRVTLKGNYTTPVPYSNLEVYLNGIYPTTPDPSPRDYSQVRAKLGTWYKIKACTWSVTTLYQGHSFSVACNEDFSCGNRRYRLYVRAINGEGIVESDGFKYFPSANGWTKKTTIDFGDLGRFLK